MFLSHEICFSTPLLALNLFVTFSPILMTPSFKSFSGIIIEESMVFPYFEIPEESEVIVHSNFKALYSSRLISFCQFSVNQYLI